jgi:hypothetical protein
MLLGDSRLKSSVDLNRARMLLGGSSGSTFAPNLPLRLTLAPSVVTLCAAALCVRP